MNYKVWHVERKEWIQDQWDLYIDPDGDIWEIEERGSYDRYMSKTWITKDVKVALYTGLKDKAGNEIYEGDIHKLDDEVGAVEYHEGTYFVIGEYCTRFLYQELTEHKGEIIGNIYEHPHLLHKEEKQ